MRVICFGDSNTYGYDPRDFFGGRYDACWVDLLARRTGWDILNAGQNGREIPVIPCSLPEHDLFLVMLGTNDLLQGRSAGETAARMETFLTAMQPVCGRIILLTPPPMQRGAWVPSDDLVKKSRHLAAEYASVANKLHIGFIDTTQWNIGMSFDGVHFSQAGHEDFSGKLYLTLTRRHGLS